MNNTAQRLTTVGVYGTLKQGRGNHSLLQHVEKHSDAWLVAGHRLYESGIPFVVEDDSGDYEIKLEIYKVDDKTLQNLDWLEGHPEFYERKQKEITLDDGSTETAWVYIHPHPVGEENVTGIF